MKKIVFLLVYILLLCSNLWSQTSSCLTIINEVEKYNDNQKAIDYILENKDSFNMDNSADVWLYNLALGSRYYLLGMYLEALPYLHNVTTTIDTYGDTMGINSNQQLLIIYYWEATCEFHTHSSKDAYLSKLHRAKSAFEKYKFTDTNYYKAILSDIDILQSGSFDLLPIITKAMEYAISGDNQNAIPLFEEIISKWPSSQNEEQLASFVQALGNCYIAVGRVKEAEYVYLKMLSNLKDKGKEDNESYRCICDALGVLYYQVHNYQKANDYSGLSKQLHEKNLDFDFSYVRCLSNCAIIESGLGHHFLAKIFIDVALKYIREGCGYDASNKVIDYFMSLSSIEGNKQDTNALSNKSNVMFQLQPYMQILSNAAMIYQQGGFWDDAVLCIKESIDINKKLEKEDALPYNNLATMYLAKSQIETSLPLFEKAVSLCKTDYEANEILFNYALALWLAHSSQCKSVAVRTSQSLTQSILSNFSFLSQEERMNFYKNFEYYLPLLNVMLYETGDRSLFGQIYDNILITKGLLLRTTNSVKETILKSGNVQVISDYNRMLSLKQQIINERDSLQRIKINEEIEKLDKRLSRNASEYGAFTKSNNIKWKDVCENLKDGDIAIEFYNLPVVIHKDTIQQMTGEPRFCAVLLKKGFKEPDIIPLCKESELEVLSSDSLYNSTTLYDLVWKPLENVLGDVRNIYFAADRELHQVGIEYALLPDKKRICDNYNIYRLTSTRLLAEDKNNNNLKNAVLFGGLNYDLSRDELIAESREKGIKPVKAYRIADLENYRYGVAYLPGTKEEVENIAQLINSTKKFRCEVITGDKGTEEAFRTLEGKDVGIIHLATHGFFWSDEITEKRSYVSFLMNSVTRSNEDKALLRSGLFFSGANVGLAGEQLPEDVEDGVITAQELSAMNLGNVNMVVLSACQSGLGETTGEGVFGLQRGFKLAGANSLLMSLWKVDDEATKLLMTEFYHNLIKGDSKISSLRKAQQYIRSIPYYNSPEYWAGWILLDALN